MSKHAGRASLAYPAKSRMQPGLAAPQRGKPQTDGWIRPADCLRYNAAGKSSRLAKK